MKDLSEDNSVFSPASTPVAGGKLISLKKLRGGFLFAIGWLLSPLCWWNDLVFNLPVAYGFGFLCKLISPDWLLPGTIVGYWLSNVVGIGLMQMGAVEVFQSETKQNFRKNLLLGVASSTVFTLVVLLLMQFKILDLPFGEGAFHFSSLPPFSAIGH